MVHILAWSSGYLDGMPESHLMGSRGYTCCAAPPGRDSRDSRPPELDCPARVPSGCPPSLQGPGLGCPRVSQAQHYGCCRLHNS